jgi:nitrate reductase gamma subunit
MGTVLIVFAYLCYLIFALRIIWRIFLLSKVPENTDSSAMPQPKTTFLTVIRTARDIVLLTRLFKVNPLLWFGEWVFHTAFVLVLIRHLRYVLDTAPGWLMDIESAGRLAGHVLPITLIYIFIVKFLIEKKNYFSTGNFFLLLLLFLLSTTGIIMVNFMPPDIIEVKTFISRALSLKTEPAPDGLLFIIHFVTASIFLAFIPAHIFAAPLTMMEARKHDDLLNQVIHEK